MANLNRIILIGRLIADPEVRYMVDGTPQAKLRLAVDRERAEGTDFVDIIAWRKLAEICGEYLKKGRLTLIEGRIQIRSYNDQSGRKKWVTEVVAHNMRMLEGKPQEEKALEEKMPPPEAVGEEAAFAPADDDLPF